jgi:hypothetical protein
MRSSLLSGTVDFAINYRRTIEKQPGLAAPWLLPVKTARWMRSLSNGTAASGNSTSSYTFQRNCLCQLLTSFSTLISLPPSRHLPA